MPQGKQAEGQRTVTFSAPKALIDEIDEARKAEKRSRSNFIVFELEKALAARRAAEKSEREKPHVLPAVARAAVPRSSSMRYSLNEEPAARTTEDPPADSPRSSRKRGRGSRH